MAAVVSLPDQPGSRLEDRQEGRQAASALQPEFFHHGDADNGADMHMPGAGRLPLLGPPFTGTRSSSQSPATQPAPAFSGQSADQSAVITRRQS